MKLFTMLAVVSVLGCAPLYKVEQLTDQSAVSGQDWKTLGIYRLPRTDLRVDAEVESAVGYGDYYCFGKELGMGAGALGHGACARTCWPDDGVVLMVRKLEVTPMTVADPAAQYVYKVRNRRRASKHTAELTTTPTAVLSGPGSGPEPGSATIVLGAFEGPPPSAGAKRSTCEQTERLAAGAARDHAAKSRCLERLAELAMSATWKEWANLPQCKNVAADFEAGAADATVGAAFEKLGSEVEELRERFLARGSVIHHSQTWIRVEKKSKEPATWLTLREEGFVKLCSTEDGLVRGCDREAKSPLVQITLQSSGGSAADDEQPVPYAPKEDGLRYRIPRTLLLRVGRLSAADDVTKETKASELASPHVMPVTFSQLGEIAETPDRIRAAPATSIRANVSEGTGMLTNVQLSLEAVLSKKSDKGTLKTTVQTVTYGGSGGAAAPKLERSIRSTTPHKTDGARESCSELCTSGDGQ